MAANPGDIIFLHSLGSAPPSRPARVVPEISSLHLQVRKVQIRSTIIEGQKTHQGPSPIAYSCDRDSGIVLSELISTPFNTTITAVATSLDGKYVAIGDDHGRVEVCSHPSSKIFT